MKKIKILFLLCVLCASVCASLAATTPTSVTAPAATGGRGYLFGALASGVTGNEADGTTVASGGVFNHYFILSNAAGQVDLTPQVGTYVYSGGTYSSTTWRDVAIARSPSAAGQIVAWSGPADIVRIKAENCAGCNWTAYWKGALAADHSAEVYTGSASRFLYNEGSLSASGNFIGIDWSDTISYPRQASYSYLVFEDVVGTMCVSAAGDWTLRYGLLVENDATDGTVWWFWGRQISAAGAECMPVTHRPLPEIPLRLLGNTVDRLITGKKDSDDTDWENDELMYTFLAAQAYPAAGDLVVEVVENSGEATMTFQSIVVYRFE